uniref:Uncharacterized protein n=1 Tax=Panagrolaimus sp. ES5 TaxID=591445 RepID=A0AC34GAD2_9BILA
MESDASVQSTSTVSTTSEILKMESQMPTTDDVLETSKSSISTVTTRSDSDTPFGITTAAPDQSDAPTSATSEILETSVKLDTTLQEIPSSVTTLKSTTAKSLTSESLTSESEYVSTDDESMHLTSRDFATTQTDILSSSTPEGASEMFDKTTTSQKIESKTTADELTQTDATTTVSKEIVTTVGKIAETTMTDGKKSNLTTAKTDESPITIPQKTNDFPTTTSLPADSAKSTTSESHTYATGELSITTASDIPSTTVSSIDVKSLLFCGFQPCASEVGYDAKISFGFHDRIGINCSNENCNSGILKALKFKRIFVNGSEEKEFTNVENSTLTENIWSIPATGILKGSYAQNSVDSFVLNVEIENLDKMVFNFSYFIK